MRRYRRVTDDEELDKILVTTMNDVPGYEIVAVYGEVFGLIVRARNVATRAALVRSLLEIARSRQLAVLVSDDPELARASGADGVHFPEVRGAEAFPWAAMWEPQLRELFALSADAVTSA